MKFSLHLSLQSIFIISYELSETHDFCGHRSRGRFQGGEVSVRRNVPPQSPGGQSRHTNNSAPTRYIQIVFINLCGTMSIKFKKKVRGMFVIYMKFFLIFNSSMDFSPVMVIYILFHFFSLLSIQLALVASPLPTICSVATWTNWPCMQRERMQERQLCGPKRETRGQTGWRQKSASREPRGWRFVSNPVKTFKYSFISKLCIMFKWNSQWNIYLKHL